MHCWKKYIKIGNKKRFLKKHRKIRCFFVRKEKDTDKTKRNELLIMLADINKLIEKLENKSNRKDEATDEIYQLLQCYELKINILKTI